MLYRVFSIVAALLFGYLLYAIATAAVCNQRLQLPTLNVRQIYELPEALTTLVLNTRIPENTLILQVTNNQAKLLGVGAALNEGRLEILQKFLAKIHATLPNGTFLIHIGDRVWEPLAYPVLAFSADKKYCCDQIILIPDCCAMEGYRELFSHIDQGIKQYPWAAKQAKIFWRGAATGMRYMLANEEVFDRLVFLNLAKKLPYIDAGFTGYEGMPDLAEKLSISHPLQSRVSPADSLAYKYLISIDGNSCTYSRMAWILYSKSVLMKHDSDDVQWFYQQMQPYVHYIPIKRDFSDLESQYTWAQNNQELALQIANNAHDFAKEIFTEDQIELAFVNGLHKANILAATRQNVK